MRDKKTYIGLAIALVAIGGLIFWGLKQPVNAPTQNPASPASTNADIIFFYGQECPHCLDVEKFLADNQVADKVKYDSLEVWHNQSNAALMKQKADACGIQPEGMGVPFLWAKGQCFVGTPDVENFFKQAAGI